MGRDGAQIIKEEGTSLYERTSYPAEVTQEAQWANVLARLQEAVDITTVNSLDDRFTTIETEDADLQAQINNILNGTTQFTDIFLPGSLTLPEWRIEFGTLGAHTHQGGPYGAVVSHTYLGDITEDDHHPRIHSMTGSDHTGTIAEWMIAWDGILGHEHDGVQASAVWHAKLRNTTPDDHHSAIHHIDSHTGSLDASRVTASDPRISGATGDMVLQNTITRMLIHENAGLLSAHGVTLFDMVSLGLARKSDLDIHVVDTDGHIQVTANTIAIDDLLAIVGGIQTTIPTMQTGITSLETRMAFAEAEIGLRLLVTDFFSLLVNYGGPGTALGGVTPIADGEFTALTIGTLTATNIVGPTSLSVDSLTVNTDITLPTGALDQDGIEPNAAAGTTWADTPTNLIEELDNIRKALSVVAGESFLYTTGASVPVIDQVTSSFAGEDLKTYEEGEYYRNWLKDHVHGYALVMDTFENDTFKDSGTVTIEDHMLKGAGNYMTAEYVFSSPIQDVTFFAVHVETNAIADVTVKVTVDGVAWSTVTDGGANDFDGDVILLPAKQGKDVTVEIITTNAATRVYSYGVLLGWID